MTVNEHPLADAGELCRLGASELTAGYASGEFTPVEVAQSVLARAGEINDRFNAFTAITADLALSQARDSAARWRRGTPLSDIDGVPVTLKDIVSIRGTVIHAGSTTAAEVPSAADAPSVARLRAAGGVFVGLTTTPEFGWKAVTDSRFSGITRNPWDETKTSGGSSGGAGVAAALGAGVLHLGTDGGGSIRVPSAFCGIVGLKPTFGRVAANPPSAFGTVAHIGPMARSVDDAAAMLAAFSGRDLDDWNQGAGSFPPVLPLPEGMLAGARIGYWKTPPCGSVDPQIATLVDAAVKRLEDMGARVEEVSLPLDGLYEVFTTHWYTGAANRLRAVPVEKHDAVDPGFLAIAAEGAAISGSDLVGAQVRRAAFGAVMDQLLARFDFLVSPSTAVLPFAAGEEVPPGSGLKRWIEWAGFSFPINLSQQPAITVPCARAPGGLPVGLQIIGARGADAAVLAAAREFERSHPTALLP
ncbi:amidase [Pseudoxanthobacter sp.]|uniref:amidase n=1 Tax=Pseudoxanthobacter sp. TaxID=1925742 RepID=UPI002FE41F04